MAEAVGKLTEPDVSELCRRIALKRFTAVGVYFHISLLSTTHTYDLSLSLSLAVLAFV